jgi:hypothetical protein
MRLIVRWRVHTMNRRLEEITSQSLQSVADVDRDGLVLRLDPLPLLLRIQDLQSGDGLAEEKCDAAQVGMARRVQLAYLLVDFRRAGCVVHVAEVVFAFDVVLVVPDELVFVGQLQDDGEEAKELDDNFVVALATEGFDLFDVVLQDGGLCTLVVAVELGEVVHLHVIFDGVGESGGSANDLQDQRWSAKHTVSAQQGGSRCTRRCASPRGCGT